MVKETKVSLLDFVNPSKNYLTLIVALIIGISIILALTLIFGSSSLDGAQRWFLISILVLFPTIGLVMSVWLILRHFRKLAVSENDGEIEWRIMSAERQQLKLNAEITGLARILNIPENQMSDLRSAYIVAEDLALRHIEKESQKPLMRHISLDKTEFDAIMIDNDVIRCIEVSFLVTPDVPSERIAAILRKTEIAKRKLMKIRPHTKLILMLALVTQLDRTGEAKLRSILSDKFSATPVDVDIRLFDFEELQRIFTAE